MKIKLSVKIDRTRSFSTEFDNYDDLRTYVEDHPEMFVDQSEECEDFDLGGPCEVCKGCKKRRKREAQEARS